MDEVRVVCWNIKSFTSFHVITDRGVDIAAVFAGGHVGFILEGPASDAQARASAALLAAKIGNGWSGVSVNVGGLGNEEESVIAVYDGNVVAGLALEAVDGDYGDNSIRQPAVATARCRGKQYKFGLWHAPPSTGEKAHLIASAWPRVAAAMSRCGVNFIMGDFNADVVAPRGTGYQCVSAAQQPTTISNPALYRIDSLADAYTNSCYDKVFAEKALVRKVTAAARYVSKLPDRGDIRATQLNQMANASGRKDPKRAFAISDHVPMLLQFNS